MPSLRKLGLCSGLAAVDAAIVRKRLLAWATLGARQHIPERPFVRPLHGRVIVLAEGFKVTAFKLGNYIDDSHG